MSFIIRRGWGQESHLLRYNSLKIVLITMEVLKAVFIHGTTNSMGVIRVFCKLDRVMGNDEWFDMVPDTIVNFLPKGVFDHAPTILTLEYSGVKGRRPFIYYNMWKGAPGASEKVAESWQESVYGVPMYKVVRKLKKTQDCFRGDQ